MELLEGNSVGEFSVFGVAGIGGLSGAVSSESMVTNSFCIAGKAVSTKNADRLWVVWWVVRSQNCQPCISAGYPRSFTFLA